MADALKKLAWKHLQDNMVVESDILIDKRVDRVLGPEVYYTICE